jgi:hypothetical protein
MKDIRNTTTRPLRVPLPKKGVLHLGPLQNGQVAAGALEHPPFQKLVEAGDLEVIGEGHIDLGHPSKKGGGHASTQGRGHTKSTRATGDR